MARTVLQQMVQEMLIEQYAKNNNIVVTDAEINDARGPDQSGLSRNARGTRC